MAFDKEVREALRGRLPLTFQGTQLFGPDPCGAGGEAAASQDALNDDDDGEDAAEVLLGEGIVALLDPPVEAGDGCIGTYELLFYGDESGAQEPLQRLVIGPKMTLKRQGREKAEFDDDEAPVETFALNVKGGQAFTLTFNDIDMAGAFERDFIVRQRLMEVALMTSKRQHAVDEARGQLHKLKTGQLMRLGQLLLAIPALSSALILITCAKYEWAASRLCSYLLG